MTHRRHQYKTYKERSKDLSGKYRFLWFAKFQKTKKIFENQKKLHSSSKWTISREIKGPMGSIEVPFDREYPHEEPVKFSQLDIYFYGREWPSK
jgi:hypothetical protein